MARKKRVRNTEGTEQGSGDSSSQKDQPQQTAQSAGGSGEEQQEKHAQPSGQQQPPGQEQLAAGSQAGGKKQQQKGKKIQSQQQGQQPQHPQPSGQQQSPGQEQLAAGSQAGGKKQQQKGQKIESQQQQHQPPGQQQQQGQRMQHPIQQQQQQPWGNQPRGQQQQQGQRMQYPVQQQQQQPWGNQPPGQQQQQGQRMQYPVQQQQQQPWGYQPPAQQQQQGQRMQHPVQQQQQQPWGYQPPTQQQQQGQRMQHPVQQQQQQPWGYQPPTQQQQQGQRMQHPVQQQQQQPWGYQPPTQQQQQGQRMQHPVQQQQQQGQRMQHPAQQQQQVAQPPIQQQVVQPPIQEQVAQLSIEQQVAQPPIQQQGVQGKNVGDQKKQPQQAVHGSPGQKAKSSKPKAPAEETLAAGVSQAVRNVHEGFTKASTPEKLASPVKTSLPTSVSLDIQKKIPKRRNPNVCGTQGRRITVLTNMMSLIMNGNFQNDAVHYDVTITPDKPKYMMRPVIEAFRKIHYPQRYPAFDGKKNLYSATLLPFGSHIKGTVTIMNEERQKEQTFEVSMNKVREVDLSVFKSGDKLQLANPGNLEALQVLDTVLRHGPSLHFTTVGRSFFQPPRQQTSLSDGMDLWVGTYQSVVLGWKPYLNVDVAHKGFPTSQNVIKLMHELSRQRTYGRDTQQQQGTAEQVNYKRTEINDYIKGLKVHYEIPGMPLSKRTVRVNGLVKAANEEIFALDDGNKCTVEQYFRIQKRYKLQYPDYPCLWIGPRDKTIYVPPELCTIMAGQATMKKLNPEQTRHMIRAAATNTEIRKQKILDAFDNLKINDAPTAKNEFGVSIQGKFEVVPARVLNPPKVHYNDRDMFVQKGVWNVGKFVEPMTMNDNEWTILNMDQRLSDSCLYGFEGELQRHAANVGMFIGKSEKPFKVIRPPTRDIREITAYFQEKKKKKLKLVIVIIPEFGDVYSKVKQITELNVGLVTQCIKRKTMDRLSEATVVNILLKINSKLNGVNHTLAKTTSPKCLASKCMIIGADVTHPAPDATQTPSIAAVTSSFDPEAFQYHIEIRLQPPKLEVIQDLEKITALQLNVFKKHRGYFPENIIVYRDGVSEGQIPQVIHHELAAIKRGCSNVLKKYLPVTFFVVQKRHHIRLFPTDLRNSDDARRNMNVQAGTIVDTQITHPTHIDFYLVSHASIQGTARPTKYKCIWNDLQMTEDDIEELTYYLCHLFARCTRSVSYPAPTYYAHLAAFRARALTQNVPIRMDKLEEEQRTKLTLQVNQDAPMFFV